MSGPSASEPTRNLFVAGLHPGVDDARFQALFAPFGQILSAKVMLDIHTGRSRGFGFVLFSDVSEAAKAKAALDESFVLDSVIHIRYSPHSGDNLLLRVPNIYVRNIPLEVPESALREVLAPAGDIKAITIRLDTSKGTSGDSNVAFVEFEAYEAATKAVELVHGKLVFPQCRVVILAKMAEPPQLRSHRRQKFRTLHGSGSGKSRGEGPGRSPGERTPDGPSLVQSASFGSSSPHSSSNLGVLDSYPGGGFNPPHGPPQVSGPPYWVPLAPESLPHPTQQRSPPPATAFTLPPPPGAACHQPGSGTVSPPMRYVNLQPNLPMPTHISVGQPAPPPFAIIPPASQPTAYVVGGSPPLYLTHSAPSLSPYYVVHQQPHQPYQSGAVLIAPPQMNTSQYVTMPAPPPPPPPPPPGSGASGIGPYETWPPKRGHYY